MRLGGQERGEGGTHGLLLLTDPRLQIPKIHFIFRHFYKKRCDDFAALVV